MNGQEFYQQHNLVLGFNQTEKVLKVLKKS